jgi:hypothetical protein
VLLATLIVLTDAALIEPIAVRAGLWSWTLPGLFHVPLIGIFGWCCFAFGVFVGWRGWHMEHSVVGAVFAPVTAHIGIVTSWFVVFRATLGDVDARMAIAMVVPAAIVLGAWMWMRHLRERVPLVLLLARLPAAVFFLVLLALHVGDDVTLLVYGAAFVPPYLALMNWRAVLPARA